MSAGHLSRQFRRAYGESPYGSRFTELVGVPPSAYRRQAARATAGMVRGETGDQTDQESRSAGHRAAASMTVMDITVHVVGPADQPGTSMDLEPPFAPGCGVTDDERPIIELAGHSERDNAERDRSRGSIASSVLATVRPLSSPEAKRLGLVRRTEVLRNG